MNDVFCSIRWHETCPMAERGAANVYYVRFGVYDVEE